MPHFRILETWRVCAALLVMLWHFLRYAPGGAEDASAILYRLLPLMEMFFMISGFLVMLRYGDTLFSRPGGLRRFIVRRFTRLYPLYLATMVFFGAIAVAVHLGLIQSNWPGRYDLAALPLNLLLVQGWGLTEHLTFNYVGWTLSAEWFCYLTFPLLVLVASRWGLAGLAVTSLVAIAALEALTASGIMPFDSWFEANTWGAYRAFADFAIGGAVALAVRRWSHVEVSHATAWSAFALTIGAMLARENPYLVLALLAFSLYLAARAEIARPQGSRWLAPLAPLGACSFGIYMIHPVIETLSFSVLWKHLLEPHLGGGFYVFWLLPMAATIVVALASARWFEGPVAAWLNARLDPPRPGIAAHA